jgi:hypothetical protein
MKKSPQAAAWKGLRPAEAASLPGRAAQVLARALGPWTAIIARSRRTVRPRAAFGQAGLHPGHVLVGGAGIDDDAPGGVGEVIDDQVVDHAAFRVQHAGVQRLARFDQLGHVVGDEAAQEGLAAGADEVEGQHVGDVEHAGVTAHGVVLLDLGAVIDRHVPAGEVDHAGACRDVGGVKGVCWGIGVSGRNFLSVEKQWGRRDLGRGGPICPLYLRDCSDAVLRAPSVDVDRRALGRGGITLQILDSSAVRLPERFRGCAFGGSLTECWRALSHTTRAPYHRPAGGGKGLIHS